MYVTDSDDVTSDVIPSSDVFFGSVIPMAYAISVATIVAWLLLILLFIAKKKRPWFQKLMALMVALSLSVILSNTTNILEEQYDEGYLDAVELRHEIFGSVTFRVLQVICLILIWIAHLQVLVRLFERPQDRVLIKYGGGVLVCCGTVMWCLVYFLVPFHMSNHALSKAVPVLAYFIQIVIETTYAGLVIVYSFRKRRFAYHTQTLVTASVSLIAVITPLAFFILDLAANSWIVGWSEFVRWVSDAAANIVVWEWIDIVETLQKEQQKLGVLGRQIYEGDAGEMKFYRAEKLSNVAPVTGPPTDPRPTNLELAPSHTSSHRSNTSDRPAAKLSNHMVLRYNARSILPFFRFKNDACVVFRSSSANTASTVYGTLANHSRPPTMDPNNMESTLTTPTPPLNAIITQQHPEQSSDSHTHSTSNVQASPPSPLPSISFLHPPLLSTSAPPLPSLSSALIPTSSVHHPSLSTPIPPSSLLSSPTSPYTPSSPLSDQLLPVTTETAQPSSSTQGPPVSTTMPTPVVKSSSIAITKIVPKIVQKMTPKSQTPPSPPSVVRHMHPLRRGTRRNSGSITPNNGARGSSSNSSTVGAAGPTVAESLGALFLSDIRENELTNGHANQHANQHANGNDHDDDDDDNENDEYEDDDYNIIYSDGFNLQVQAEPMTREHTRLLLNGEANTELNANGQHPPPSFEPLPGFTNADYWDEKR